VASAGSVANALQPKKEGGGVVVDERKRRAGVAAQKNRSENWLGEAGLYSCWIQLTP
jgi:hypothetical protein